jgi:hypothetical protein
LQAQGSSGQKLQIRWALARDVEEQHCIMVALWNRKHGGRCRRRLLTGNNPLCPFDGGEGDKAAQTAAFLFRRLL